MSDDLRARLERLKPVQETVVVDDVELILRAPTLLQYGDFMDAVGAIDPEPLLAAGLPIILSALEGGDEVSLLRAIAEQGAAIWRAVTANLGAPAAKALSRGVAALLDTKRNFDALAAASVLRADQHEADEGDNAFVGSAALRAWVVRNITPEQALYVAERAWTLGKVKDLGKALLAGMTARRPAPVNGTPVAPPAPAAPTSAAG